MSLIPTLEQMPPQEEINKRLEKAKPKEKAKPEAEKKTEQQIIDEMKKPGALKMLLARWGVKKYYDQVDKLIDQGWRKGPEGWEKDLSLEKPETVKETAEAIETAAQEEKAEAAAAISETQAAIETTAGKLEVQDKNQELEKQAATELQAQEEMLAGAWEHFISNTEQAKKSIEKPAEKKSEIPELLAEMRKQYGLDQEKKKKPKTPEQMLKNRITNIKRLEQTQNILYQALQENPDLKGVNKFSKQTEKIIQQLTDLRQAAESADPTDTAQMKKIQQADKELNAKIRRIDQQINKEIMVDSLKRLQNSQAKLYDALWENPDLKGVEKFSQQTQKIIGQLDELHKKAAATRPGQAKQFEKLKKEKDKLIQQIQEIDDNINDQIEAEEKTREKLMTNKAA